MAPSSRNQNQSKFPEPPKSEMLSGNSGHSENKPKQKIMKMQDSFRIPKIRKMMQEEEIRSRSQRSIGSQGSRPSSKAKITANNSKGKITAKRMPFQKPRLNLDWPETISQKKTVQNSPQSEESLPRQESPMEYLEIPPKSMSKAPTMNKQPRSEWVRRKKERLTANELNPSVLAKRKGALNWQTKIEASKALPKSKVNFLIRRKSCECKDCGGEFSKYKMMINSAINVEEHVNELDIEPNGSDASKMPYQFGQKSTRGVDFGDGDDQSQDPDTFNFGGNTLPVSKRNVYKMGLKKSITGTWGLKSQLTGFQGSSMRVPNTMPGKEKGFAHQHTYRASGDIAKLV